MTADCISKTSVDQWATAYNLRNKVRCAPGVITRLKNAEVSHPKTFVKALMKQSPQQEGRLLFVSYVGALCIQSGYTVVQDWINQLLEPSEKRVKSEPSTALPSPLPQQIGPPPDVAAASQARFMNQFKSDTPTYSQPSPRISQPPPYISGSNNAFSNANGLFPPQPAGTSFQPPPPATKPPPLPPTPTQNPQVSFLPLFNQTASQRRLGVEYTAQFFGPPHAGKWHVKCLGGFLPSTVLLASIRNRAVSTDDSIAPQSTTSKRAKAPDRANKLPRRRLLNRLFTPWGGQARFVLGPVSKFCERSEQLHEHRLDSVPTSHGHSVSLIRNYIGSGLPQESAKKNSYTLYGRTSPGNLAFCVGAYKHKSTFVLTCFFMFVCPS